MIKEKEVVVKSDKSNQQFTHISILQIIGPILVILGHSLNGMQTVFGIQFDQMGGFGSIWHMFSKHWIYLFHMALFFMISGYLFAAKGYMRDKKYKTVVKEKFWRLLFPYLFWNLICYLPKIYFQQFTPDKVSLDIMGIVKTFLCPRQNIWGHTWFLPTLFMMYLAGPVWQKLFKTKKAEIITICASAVLCLVPINTPFLSLGDLRKFTLFFVLGMALGNMSIDDFRAHMKKYAMFYICGAIVTSVIFVKWYYELEFIRFISSTFILLALMAITSTSKGLSPIYTELAKRSFGIYIMHWPVMITLRTICMHIGINLGLTIVLAVIGGFIIPNIIISVAQKMKLGKFKIFKYLLGV